MNRSITLALIIIAAACEGVHGQTFDWSFLRPDEALKSYAVSVNYPAPFERPYPLYGVYLGQGMVLTAAHVVGRRAALINPRVVIAGQSLSAKVLKQGSFEEIDLALLSVDQTQVPLKLRLRRDVVLCNMPPRIGADVVIAYPERTARSQIISPRLARVLAHRTRFTTLLNDVQVSGSGVFDAQRKCLDGIISASLPVYSFRHMNQRAGYFVPAPTIAEFVRAWR
jgi:hypothetical protein